MVHVITHRGIDADRSNFFTESSREAFEDFLIRGYGIEFDIRITKDALPVISHDASLDRLTNGAEIRSISEMTASEFIDTPLPRGTTVTLEGLIELMNNKGSTTALHACHLKSYNQSTEEFTTLAPFLARLPSNCIIFDVKPEIVPILAQYGLASRLAASVAHQYDIERYNLATGETLISLEDFINYGYGWAWLDEWDRSNVDNITKNLYTVDVFNTIRSLGRKIAVISPELHASSPKLLGSESHQDAQTMKSLTRRWHEIITLQPDAICTDFPDRVTDLIPRY